MPGSSGFDPARYIPVAQVVEIIQSNIKADYLASNNSIKYYAYGNRDPAGSFFDVDGTEAARPADAVAVVDVFPMLGTISAPVIEDGTTDLMYITFHVVTALENNVVFEEILSTDDGGDSLNRTLNKGDQIIRWYIPAILIPQRTLNPDSGALSGNTRPIRVHYKVGLNEKLFELGVSEEYISEHSEGDDVYFYTNNNPENETLAFYQPHEFNPYFLEGRPGYNERGISKSSNPTGTASIITQYRHKSMPGGARADMQWLGNNGRLTMSLQKTPPDVPPDEPPELPPEVSPSPSEPAPQTGTFQRASLYTALLITSFILMGGTFAYIGIEKWLHKKKHRSKHE